MSSDSEIKIGVYICHCGKNIAGVLDIDSLVSQVKKLPDVFLCVDDPYMCAEPGQERIKKDIEESGINRVCICACSPKLHETTFRTAAKEAGLNPYLVEMANIREQCSWVHIGEDGATKKAFEIIKSVLAKLRLAKPLKNRFVPVNRKALVIGGGIAGIRAALSIAESGYKTYLLEKEPYLGGNLNRLYALSPTFRDPQNYLVPLITSLEINKNVEVITRANIKSVKGFIGNFSANIEIAPSFVKDNCKMCGICERVCPVSDKDDIFGRFKEKKAIYIPELPHFSGTYLVDPSICTGCGECEKVCPENAIDLSMKPNNLEIDFGAMVVATGSSIFSPDGMFGYGKLLDVVTNLELEAILKDGLKRPSDKKPPERVGFIQCVGTRGNPSEYCSRICCAITLKQSILLREKGVEVVVYHKDMRAIKKPYEDLYRKARQEGVFFVRANISSVEEKDDKLKVKGVCEDIGDFEDHLDMVVLACGLVPQTDMEDLSKILKLQRTPCGFFLEAHPKLKPLETALDGVFIAGCCHFPKDVSESISQAEGASALALSILSKDTLELDAIYAHVNEELCIGCGICERECPFQAIKVVEKDGKKVASVIEAACKGCGICAGSCPVGACDVDGFTTPQITSQIDELLSEKPEEKILAFCCNWCSYAGADAAGTSRLKLPLSLRIVRVMCSGRVSEELVLYAFSKGAGMVLISGCHPPQDCHYISGNISCEKRIDRVKKKMKKLGIDPKRLRLEWISATEATKFRDIVWEMDKELKEINKKR